MAEYILQVRKGRSELPKDFGMLISIQSIPELNYLALMKPEHSERILSNPLYSGYEYFTIENGFMYIIMGHKKTFWNQIMALFIPDYYFLRYRSTRDL